MKKIASNVLELTHTIPEMNDEMHFIVNVYLIVDICLGLYHNKEKNIDRSAKGARYSGSIFFPAAMLRNAPPTPASHAAASAGHVGASSQAILESSLIAMPRPPLFP